MKILTFLILLIFFVTLTSCKKTRCQDCPPYAQAYTQCVNADRQARLTCMEGAMMPDFEGMTLDNKAISSSTMSDKAVVINFWATYCKPCIAEIPGLNEITELYKGKEVEFISVTREGVNKIAPFLQRIPFSFQNILDPYGAISQDTFHNDMGLPLTLVFDRSGKLIKMISGGRIDSGATEHIKSLLIPAIDQALL